MLSAKGIECEIHKVLIKKCDNPSGAAKIAEEIAKRSGSTPEVVLA